MSEVFLGFLNRSITAGWLVLAVLVLRFALRRAPKWVDVLLWGMVALRLAVPFSIESAVSLIPSAETVSPEVVQFDPAPTVTSGVTVIDNAVNPALSESFAADPAASVNPLYVWTEIAGVVWLIGAAALLGYALVSYLRLRRRVRTAVRLRENIYQSEHVASPFILGVLHPRIYLPFSMSGENMECVLAHERAHLARHDHWWKPMGFLLLALYWFNPVLWLAYVLLCRDIELACDERVVKTLDPARRADYSQALLACSVPRRMIAACPLAFGEVGVKERVKSVLNYRKPAFWVIVLSVAACAVVAVCFLTNPQRETMRWARELRAEDVTRVELVVLPQAENRQYKELNADEIGKAVMLINESRGRHVRNEEPLNGGVIRLFVTTSDGVRHHVGNNGNVYLEIDGDSYKADYAWLEAWPFTEGDAPLPEDFDFDFTYPTNTMLAQTEYPIAEETVTAALRAAEVNGTVTDGGVLDAGGAFSYQISCPDENAELSVSGALYDGMRELSVSYALPFDGSNTLTGPEWTDFKTPLKLAARFYGGFTDGQELYRACAASELAREENVLYQGQLNGGYCVVRVNSPVRYWTANSLRKLTVEVYESTEAFAQHNGTVEAGRVYVDEWSLQIPDGWEREGSEPIWRSSAGTGSYLRVTEESGFDETLMGLYNAGYELEKFYDHYRCVTQEGMSNTVVYLYPQPESIAFYWIEMHWSYENADERQIQLEEMQLKAMGHTFAFRSQEEVWNVEQLRTVFDRQAESGWRFVAAVSTDLYEDLVGAVLYRRMGDEIPIGVMFVTQDGIGFSCGLGGELAEDPAFVYRGEGTVAFRVKTDDGGRAIMTLQRTIDGPQSSVLYTAATEEIPTITGFAAYDNLLADVSAMRRIKSSISDYQAEFGESAWQLAKEDETGWLLRDLDGDGVPELLLGVSWSGNNTVIFNIFRLEGDRAVRLVDGWNRCRYYLCTDGSIANSGDGGIYEYSDAYYRYIDGELKLLEMVQYTASDAGGEVWYYSDTSDDFLLEQPDGTHKRNPAFHEISEREAGRINRKYTYEILPFTPFEA